MAGDPASAVDVTSRNRLTIDFIFEVTHGGGETSVQSHVGIAEQNQPERERKRLSECFLLKNAASDDLAGDGGHDFIVTRGQNINPVDFRFLVKLFGAEFDRLADALVLSLLKCLFKKQQLEQVRIVKVLRIAFEESHGRQFRLL